MRVGRRTLPFGNRPAGFAYRDVDRRHRGNTLQLDATFASGGGRPDASRATTRSCPGSPSFEAWTTYEGAGASLADLNALQITVPTGAVHWLTGLQGDTANVPTDSAFTLQQQTLAAGAALLARRHASRLREDRAVVLDRRRARRVLRGVDVVGRLVG